MPCAGIPYGSLFCNMVMGFLSGPRGCVLAFNVLYATHILMNYMLSKTII